MLVRRKAKAQVTDLRTFMPALTPDNPGGLWDCLGTVRALPDEVDEAAVAHYAHTLRYTATHVSRLYSDEFLAPEWAVVQAIQAAVNEKVSARVVTRYALDAHWNATRPHWWSRRTADRFDLAVYPAALVEGPHQEVRHRFKIAEVAFMEGRELARVNGWAVREVPPGMSPWDAEMFTPPAGLTEETVRNALMLWAPEDSVVAPAPFEPLLEATHHAMSA